ncbi:MAG: beta-methylgalactoside transporter, partial [Ruthenibacterium sp.]
MKENRFSKEKRNKFLLNNAIYIVVLLLFIVIVAAEPSFMSIKNFSYILTQSATKIIMALGVAGIIVLGGTDLSVGRMIGMTAVVTASLLQSVDSSRRIYPNMPMLPILLPILLAMLLCVVFSILHGISVFKFKVAPFIASLAIQLIVYGVMSLYFEQANAGSPIGNLDKRFTNFAQGAFDVFGMRLPYILFYVLIVIGIMWVLWNKTELGRNMFAIGGNKEAASVCGVNIIRNAVIIYMIAGLLYGFAGSLEV